MTLEEEEWDHANASMFAGCKYDGTFHVSIVTTGGKECADSSALDFVEIFLGDVCGAEGVANAGEVVHSIGNDGVGVGDRIA